MAVSLVPTERADGVERARTAETDDSIAIAVVVVIKVKETGASQRCSAGVTMACLSGGILLLAVSALRCATPRVHVLRLHDQSALGQGSAKRVRIAWMARAHLGKARSRQIIESAGGMPKYSQPLLDVDQLLMMFALTL
jgi:hypothetical protein